MLKSYLVGCVYSDDVMLPNCGPLWFLTCLFLSYMFFWVLIERCQSGLAKISISILYVVIYFVIVKIEFMYNVSKLPWHIETSLIASVFMSIGFFSCKYESKINRIIASKFYIILVTVIIFLILVNGQVDMASNRYGNSLLLFIVCATVMSLFTIEVVEIIEKTNGLKYSKRLLKWCGKNTIFFMGFNYILNDITVWQVCMNINTNNYVRLLIQVILVTTQTSFLIYFWKIIKEFVIHKVCNMSHKSDI